MKSTHSSRPSQWLVGASLIGLASLSLVQAGDVSVYGVGKKQIYAQNSASAPAPAADGAYAFTAFTVPTSADSLVFVTVTPPSGDMQFLDSINNGYELEITAAALTELNSTFPSGQYTLTAQSSDFLSTVGPANLTLTGDTYPNTPQLSNYSATQTVDPTKDLVLNWNVLANPTANDFVELRLKDDSGDVVYDSGLPGQANALPGTAQSVTIPANTLTGGNSYDAALTFGRITSRDTTDYPGGVGVTTYAQETRFSVLTTGNSGGGGTGIPPVLFLVNPMSGSKNVSLDSPVVFTFTVPMAPVQAIAWSPNVVAGDFTYTWGASGTNLTAKYKSAFPANALISWTLDPSVFKSQSGTALFAFNLTGSFTTGSGGSSTNNPCDGGSTNTGLGSLTVYKSVRYVQTSANAPVLDTETAAMFSASLNSPTTNPVSQVTLQLPNGTIKPLTNLFGTFLTLDEFATQEALDAAYPAGVYTATITRTVGTAVIPLTIAATAPPTPQITNFAQTQNFDPTSDLPVQWLPFTGATGNDSIFIDMGDSTGANFHAPDPCIPRELANTAISTVVPKNTFGAGAAIDGSLGFTKFGSVNTNTVPDLLAYAAYGKITSFKASTSGGTQATKPTIENFTRLANGTVQFQVKGTAGSTLGAQASTDLKNWTIIMSAPSPSGVLSVTDAQAAGMPARFYRAQQQ